MNRSIRLTTGVSSPARRAAAPIRLRRALQAMRCFRWEAVDASPRRAAVFARHAAGEEGASPCRSCGSILDTSTSLTLGRDRPPPG
jgi:hypothetical protein